MAPAEQDMSSTSSACPKCGGAMVPGYVYMKSPGRMVARVFEVVSMWAEGAPSRGLFSAPLGARKTAEVVTSRCAGCGYLEAFAP